MKQPKWITAIEVTDHREPGYWVKRGWDKVARMKSTPVGGIAHAGARGISKVELQVDEGSW
jgi:DMSO/TMAO reductase YedYZ molybdopterin-dependent catalytic subunit